MRYLVKVEGERPIDVPKLSREELTVKDLNKLYSIRHHREYKRRESKNSCDLSCIFGSWVARMRMTNQLLNSDNQK